MGYIVKSSRIVCAAKCILNFDGTDFCGMIENISLTGALIKLKDKMPGSIKPGDMCDMMLCSNPDLFPVKYTCKVIRFDAAIMGIEFLELNTM